MQGLETLVNCLRDLQLGSVAKFIFDVKAAPSGHTYPARA